ncbi:DUF1552 domain-containing protein [Marinicellulosiphila megalodicopiae]|uniref:DUF1552 domain-containing protein n=1 Tax=Marinicellulosiphila megalodicopiae TaxID=2724896 RepID=UPI003BB001C3
MNKSLFNNYNRRNLIKTLGVASAAPFIPVLQAQAAVNVPKRVCFISTPNGIAQEVVPTGNGTNMMFQSVLQPVEAYKNHITYLHGIDMKSYDAQRIENGHPSTAAMLFTGALTTDPGTDPHSGRTWDAQGISIDHYLGNRLAQSEATLTKFKVINAGVKTGFFSANQIFPSAGNPIRPVSNVSNLHNQIFNGVTPSSATYYDPAALRAISYKKSALDVVRDELNAVLNNVASEDRRKIEAHLTGIREIEIRLEKEEKAAAVNASVCSIPPKERDGRNSEEDYIFEGEGMMDIITHAFACDQTRIATLQWSNGASGETFPSLGLNSDHHSYTHDNYNANAGNRRKIAEWYGKRFAYFVDKLASIPEGDGTMLDNTLLVWTSEHSDFGQHGRRNIPFTLAGNLGGALNVGQKLDYSNDPKAHNDVYISIAHAMGFTDVDTFGLESICGGPLPGLLNT